MEDIFKEESQHLPPNLSKDEQHNLILKRTQMRLLSLSSSLLVKIGPCVKTILAAKGYSELENEYATIQVTSLPPLEKALLYRRMFDRFINAPNSISLACSNHRLLGEIDIKDVFVLTLFCMITCKRVRGDDMLQLFVSGQSSSGKTRLIEAVLMRTAHNLVCSNSSSDAGVGRFEIGDKNILLLHDTSLKSLFGPDCDRLKAMARGETLMAKTHGSVVVVDPAFLFATSNERLFDHLIQQPGKLPIKLVSHVKETAKLHGEHIRAFRNRFLEFHLRSRPFQEEHDLRASDNFSKEDFILGVYPTILGLMSKYQPHQFHSFYFIAYILSGLHKHAPLVTSVFDSEDHKTTLNQLFSKFSFCPM